MAAKYPEIFISLPGTIMPSLSEIYSGESMGGSRFRRLTNVLMGASFKIDPEMQKKLNRGQGRTLSEKISVEIKLVFIDKEAYQSWRELINQQISMLWFDPEDPNSMVAILWELSLKVKGELEGGDGYTVILGADHEVRTGAAFSLVKVENLRLISGTVVDADGVPVEATITDPIGFSFTERTDSEGRWWLLFVQDYYGGTIEVHADDGVSGVDFVNYDIRPKHEHIIHFTLTPGKRYREKGE